MEISSSRTNNSRAFNIKKTNKMKQTAVEWFMEQIASKDNDGFYIIDSLEDVANVFLQAKEMEKQQIIDAHNDGHNYYDEYGIDSEEYYDKTFKTRLQG